MLDLPPNDYDGKVQEFIRWAADDFRRSAATEPEQRDAICRYFHRGISFDYSQSELIDFLGVSSPSSLDMAGYSDSAAQRIMDMLADITDNEIQNTAI